jgi:hypothetical protein
MTFNISALIILKVFKAMVRVRVCSLEAVAVSLLWWRAEAKAEAKARGDTTTSAARR